MEFAPTRIPDVVVIDPVVYEDRRGFLMETWHEEKFRNAGIDARFVQDVHSRSAMDTVRGLHYQINQAQGKLIRVIRGEAFDVAVDIRKSSPTYGQWVGEILSEGNRRLMWVPAGFAHGFMVLSDFADFEYRMTNFHAPEYARSIRWDDPDIAIEWPGSGGRVPLMSEADSRGAAFRDAEVYA
jgi:dTDP-4-dehydrorhamnose 3,5-epimerase